MNNASIFGNLVLHLGFRFIVLGLYICVCVFGVNFEYDVRYGLKFFFAYVYFLFDYFLFHYSTVYLFEFFKFLTILKLPSIPILSMLFV